ncbi:unnamed protein product [Pieris macdunnoughi]|uniref:Uncharacterized protein n=1 Tax=Pieris macdunnoughi TaxID=345717 RepID=A0A821UHG3_9NEOP|nr:unnamed protein product [Pieris macdunnoughi]
MRLVTLNFALSNLDLSELDFSRILLRGGYARFIKIPFRCHQLLRGGGKKKATKGTTISKGQKGFGETCGKHKSNVKVDENTDSSTIKHLALIVRTAVDFHVEDRLLSLIPDIDGTATALYV